MNNEAFLVTVENNDYWEGVDYMTECMTWAGLKKTEAWNEFSIDTDALNKYNLQMSIIVPLLPKNSCDEIVTEPL